MTSVLVCVQDEKVPDVKLPNKVKDPEAAFGALQRYDELAKTVQQGGHDLMERLMEMMDLDAYLTIHAFNSFMMNGGDLYT